MKKILLTFLSLSFFVFTFTLPILLGLHSSMMQHHNMQLSECMEHCVIGEAYTDTPKIISFNSFLEFFLAQLIFSKIREIVIPLALLYALLSHAPPNLLYRIKNYDYSSLIGIVKLTT